MTAQHHHPLRLAATTLKCWEPAESDWTRHWLSQARPAKQQGDKSISGMHKEESKTDHERSQDVAGSINLNGLRLRLGRGCGDW